MLTESINRQRALNAVKPIIDYLCIDSETVNISTSSCSPFPGFTVESPGFNIIAYIGCRLGLINGDHFSVEVMRKDKEEGDDSVYGFCYKLDPDLFQAITLGTVIELTKSCMPFFIRELKKSINN